MEAEPRHFAPVPVTRAALGCCCPRCGEGRLFSGLLTVRPACPSCGLDFSAEDAGDGPAGFVIFFLGLIVVGFAALVGGILLLRPLKAGLIALQYRHDLLHSPPPRA